MENTSNSGPDDTPRTDKAIVDYTNPWAVFNLARTLERELSEAKGSRDYWEAAGKRERAERQKEVGMQEYRGNTVSYIYDKERNYGAHFDRMRKEIEALKAAINEALGEATAGQWTSIKDRFSEATIAKLRAAVSLSAPTT